jgi:membrane protein implicated in regulation of membrane protease activity
VQGLTFVAVPAVLALAFHWFPDTPLGRRVLPPPPGSDEVLPDPALRRRLRECIGRTGRVTSELVPWGRVEIDDLACDALAEAAPIAAGELVELTAVQGAAVVVRRRPESPFPVQPAAPAQPEAASVQPAPAGSLHVSPDGGPALSPTLETFDFETLEP